MTIGGQIHFHALSAQKKCKLLITNLVAKFTSMPSAPKRNFWSRIFQEASGHDFGAV